MKLLTPYCWLFTTACFAQLGQHPSPERKDNVVLLYTYDADSLAYQRILTCLSAQEWFLAQSSPPSFLIKTSPRTVPAFVSGEVYLVVSKPADEPHLIVIKAFFQSSAIGGTSISGQVEYIGAENALYKKSFALMQQIAKCYPDQQRQVFYNRR